MTQASPTQTIPTHAVPTMPSSGKPSGGKRSRWLAPTILAATLCLGLGAAPAPVRAQDTLTRVLVDIADVVFRAGTPYYRYGHYRADDRLVVGRDRYGRVVYYRLLPLEHRYDRRVHDRRVRDRVGPPYGKAYGYYRNGPGSNDFWCRKHGDCRYYDSRHDRYGGDQGEDRDR